MVASVSAGSPAGTSERRLDHVALISGSRFTGLIIAASAVVWLVGVARIVLLAVIGTSTALSDLSRLDLDSDLTIPSWYSSLLLAALALLTFLVGISTRAKRPKDVWRWNLLSVLFLLLSIDEAIAIHEMSLRPLESLDMPSIFTFGWIPFAIVLVVLLATIYVPFVLRLPRRLAAGMIISAVIYVFGVIGMGMINGAVFDALNAQKDFGYSLLSSVEEGFEIAGLTILIVVLVKHLWQGEPAIFGFGP